MGEGEGGGKVKNVRKTYGKSAFLTRMKVYKEGIKNKNFPKL